MKKKKANRKPDGIKRTAAQAAAEKKAVAKYIKDLKSDKRTTWEVVTDDPDYILILRAPLDSDLSGYAEYGWVGPFKYLEEAYAEAGPFSFHSGVDTAPYREIGLVRSGRVLSDKELKFAYPCLDALDDLHLKTLAPPFRDREPKVRFGEYSREELLDAFEKMKKSRSKSSTHKMSEDDLAQSLGFEQMSTKKKSKKSGSKKKVQKSGSRPRSNPTSRASKEKPIREILSFFSSHGYPLEFYPADEDKRDIWEFDGGLHGITISVAPAMAGHKVWIEVVAPNGDGIDLSGYTDGWVEDFGDYFLEFIAKHSPTKNPKSSKRKSKRKSKKSNLKKKAKKAGKEIKKVAKSDVGRAGIGGGIGALALGPIGAVAGAGIAMATKKEKGAKAKDNPSLAKSIKQKRARSGAVKAARFSSVGSEVSQKSLRARLAQINPATSGPMDKTLDQYAKAYIKKRAAYLDAAMAPGSSPGDIARTKKQFDDAAQKLTLYAEIRNMDPADLQRFMEHAAKKQKEAQRKGNPEAIRHRPKSKIYEDLSITPDTPHLGGLEYFPKAVEIWEQAYDAARSAGISKERAANTAWWAVENAGYYKDAKGNWRMPRRRFNPETYCLSENPLKHIPKGASQSQARSIISKNIAAEMEAGKPQRQAIAIALHSAREDAPRLMESMYPTPNAYHRSQNPKKAAKRKSKKSSGMKSSAGELINRCQKLWDQYCDKPTKKSLRKVLDHLEAMKSSKSEKVKKERARCLRAANKEAKRLKLK